MLLLSVACLSTPIFFTCDTFRPCGYLTKRPHLIVSLSACILLGYNTSQFSGSEILGELYYCGHRVYDRMCFHLVNLDSNGQVSERSEENWQKGHGTTTTLRNLFNNNFCGKIQSHFMAVEVCSHSVARALLAYLDELCRFFVFFFFMILQKDSKRPPDTDASPSMCCHGSKWAAPHHKLFKLNPRKHLCLPGNCCSSSLFPACLFFVDPS